MTQYPQKNEIAVAASIARCAQLVAASLSHTAVLAAMGDELVAVLRAGGKVLAAGNGGSAAEAMHMAEELTGRFKTNRAPLPAVALCADPTLLTCIGNDFGFDAVFSRSVEALGRPGDLLVLFSTSGNSPNLVNACTAARARGMKVHCLLGKSGGALAGQGDRELIVAATETARIQEVHQLAMHILLEIVEVEF
ncbi:MAG: SIS domain-containing protein, partial [bacterium]